MGILIDIHVHTKKYSQCSTLDPDRLIKQAVKAGLQGVVITEHHHQWELNELQELVTKSGEMGFILLAGFEYTSSQGDILVYGLSASQSREFKQGWSPEDTVARAHDMGAICIAAHPTRMGLGFDENIFKLGLDAIEISSVNLKIHEQRLAKNIVDHSGLPAIAASDAHQLQDVGRYALDFSVPIIAITDLQDAVKHGKFQVKYNSNKKWG